MSFAAPAFLWLLVVPAAGALAAVVRHRRRLLEQRRLASPSVWRQVMGGMPATGLVRLLAWCAGTALLVLALARPQWGELPRQVSVRTRDIVVAVDVSDSMRCGDVSPSRLGSALHLIRSALPALDGNRIGVVVFSGDAYPLVPLTTDLEAAGTFLKGVEAGMVALPGSNLERAVAASIELLPEEGEGRVVVLVSDGENLQGDPERAASRLKDAGVRLLGVLVGTAEGGPIPVGGDGDVRYKRDRKGRVVVTHARSKTLASLARGTGGALIDAGAAGSRDLLARSVAELQSREVKHDTRVARVERFQLFLALAAFAVLAGFAAPPWRKVACVGLFLLVAGASPAGAQAVAPGPDAGEPPVVESAVPWYQRLIPGGARRMARSGLGHWRTKDVPGAVRDFSGAAALDPDNPDRLYDLGTAGAAAGDVEHAAPLLARAARGGSPHAAYNLGTAALGEKKADQAVTWLRQALLGNPDDPDIKRNYELALRLLEKQKKDNKRQQDKKRKDDGSKQDQQRRRRDRAGQPTPTPTPAGGQEGVGPTPQPPNPLYGALERAEAAARAKMNRPTPHPARVEEDW